MASGVKSISVLAAALVAAGCASQNVASDGYQSVRRRTQNAGFGASTCG